MVSLTNFNSENLKYGYFHQLSYGCFNTHDSVFVHHQCSFFHHPHNSFYPYLQYGLSYHLQFGLSEMQFFSPFYDTVCLIFCYTIFLFLTTSNTISFSTYDTVFSTPLQYGPFSVFAIQFCSNNNTVFPTTCNFVSLTTFNLVCPTICNPIYLKCSFFLPPLIRFPSPLSMRSFTFSLSTIQSPLLHIIQCFSSTFSEAFLQ